MYINGVEIEDTFAEAFEMWGARLIITARTREWAMTAARVATGLATSIIGCGCEAGINDLSGDEPTPDGRPGVAALFFTTSVEAMETQLLQRVGQGVMTSPTSACYNGLDAADRVKVGGKLRYFGDGFQSSKLLDGRRLWRVPVMEGEFVVEEEFGVCKAVGGGNFFILGKSVEAALAAAEASVAAMRAVPGAIVRSGSKVSSKYKGQHVSSNTPYCPTIRTQVATALPDGVEAVQEIVIDGMDEGAVREARRIGISEGCLPGVYGRRRVTVGDMVDVEGRGGDNVTVTGDLRHVKKIGHGMSMGSKMVDGDVGPHLGSYMSGGEIVVEGKAGDWVGAHMKGGRIIVKGDCGHFVRGAYSGETKGVTGGTIVVQGSVGREVGTRMRRGLIVVMGDTGEFAAANMIAGSILVFGRLGERPGAGMKRGTIAAFGEAPELLPTFRYACRFEPVFLRFYLRRLSEWGIWAETDLMDSCFRRHVGDVTGGGKGEILIRD